MDLRGQGHGSIFILAHALLKKSYFSTYRGNRLYIFCTSVSAPEISNSNDYGRLAGTTMKYLPLGGEGALPRRLSFLFFFLSLEFFLCSKIFSITLFSYSSMAFFHFFKFWTIKFFAKFFVTNML